MREKDHSEEYLSFLKTGVFEFLPDGDKDLITNLVKLSFEFTVDIAEAINDVAKDISNRIMGVDEEDKNILMLGVIVGAVTRSLGWYLGNYEMPYRPILCHNVIEYLKESIEEAAVYLRRSCENND